MPSTTSTHGGRRTSSAGPRGGRAAAAHGRVVARRDAKPMATTGRTAASARTVTFGRLEAASFVHSVIYLALLVCAFVLGNPQPETFMLGLAHGLLWIAMSLVCIAAARGADHPVLARGHGRRARRSRAVRGHRSGSSCSSAATRANQRSPAVDDARVRVSFRQMAVETGTVQVVMPAMGDSVAEGTVLEWHKQRATRSPPTRRSSRSRPTRSTPRSPRRSPARSSRSTRPRATRSRSVRCSPRSPPATAAPRPRATAAGAGAATARRRRARRRRRAARSQPRPG